MYLSDGVIGQLSKFADAHRDITHAAVFYDGSGGYRITYCRSETAAKQALKDEIKKGEQTEVITFAD